MSDRVLSNEHAASVNERADDNPSTLDDGASSAASGLLPTQNVVTRIAFAEVS